MTERGVQDMAKISEKKFEIKQGHRSVFSL